MPIQDFVAFLVEHRYVTPASIRKAASAAIWAAANGSSEGPPKASAKYVKDMAAATAEIMTPGQSVLISPQVDANRCAEYHVKSCELCGMEGEVLKECYYSRLDNVLRCGWSPPMQGQVSTKYPVKNSSRLVAFKQSVMEATGKLLRKQAVIQAEHSAARLISAINVVIKGVDRHYAESKGYALKSDSDVEVVNRVRQQEGLQPVKVRVVHDYTGSGLNGTQTAPRYSNVDIGDLLDIVSPECWFAVGDLRSYYESFSLGEDFVGWLAFLVDNCVFIATRIMFGFSPAPAFCATFTAEMLAWIWALGIAAVAMTDDFCLVANSKTEATESMAAVVSMLSNCGFAFSEEKFQLSQTPVYLGFQVDSKKMTVSFQQESVRSYLSVLHRVQARLRSNQRVSLGVLNSMAGKLNHYAVLVQRGRLHIRSMWRCIHDYSDFEKYRPSMLSDVQFWIATLAAMATLGELPQPFPILSAQDVRESPDLVVVVRSDASGLVASSPEGNGGWGYVAGTLHDRDPMFRYGRWRGRYQFGPHSHCGELTVLLLYLHESFIPCQLLVWVTDCASAAYSMNKGYCSSEESFQVLAEILEFCDSHRIWVVALWWPREQGQLEDSLTHLSALLHRDTGMGTVSSLPELRATGGCRTQCQEGYDRC